MFLMAMALSVSVGFAQFTVEATNDEDVLQVVKPLIRKNAGFGSTKLGDPRRVTSGDSLILPPRSGDSTAIYEAFKETGTVFTFTGDSIRIIIIGGYARASDRTFQMTEVDSVDILLGGSTTATYNFNIGNLIPPSVNRFYLYFFSIVGATSTLTSYVYDGKMMRDRY